MTRMVKNVVASWEWVPLGKDKVGIIIPADQDHRQVHKVHFHFRPFATISYHSINVYDRSIRVLSRLFQSRFVDLLEFCDETMKVKEVIAVFGRADLTVAAGFPRTLRYVGFRVVAPENFPPTLDATTHFAMTYVV